MSSTASLTVNRTTIGFPGPVMDWLRYESEFLGVSVPALVREKVTFLWRNRQPLIAAPDQPGRPPQR